MAGLKWDLRPSRLFEWLGEVRRRQVEAGVQRVADRNAKRIEEWMRANAAWQDITGDARSALRAEVIDITGRAVLVLLQHGVTYGVYLETVSGGKFAILSKALDTWLPVIWRDVQMEITSGTFILDSEGS